MEEKKQPLTFDDNLIKSQSICKFSSPPQKTDMQYTFAARYLLKVSAGGTDVMNEMMLCDLSENSCLYDVLFVVLLTSIDVIITNHSTLSSLC